MAITKTGGWMNSVWKGAKALAKKPAIREGISDLASPMGAGAVAFDYMSGGNSLPGAIGGTILGGAGAHYGARALGRFGRVPRFLGSVLGGIPGYMAGSAIGGAVVPFVSKRPVPVPKVPKTSVTPN